MTIIELMANDQKLDIMIEPTVASGDVKSTQIHVEFSPEWAGYAKSAVFFNSNDVDNVIEKVMTDGTCKVPAEVIKKESNLFIGVRGVIASTGAVKTSTLVKYKIEEGAPAGTGTEVPPTADVYQQLLSKTIDLEKRFANLITAETEDGEVKDIRYGADGVKYPTAGDAVREQFRKNNEAIAEHAAAISMLDYKSITITSSDVEVDTAWNTTGINVGDFVPELERFAEDGYFTFKLEVEKNDVLTVASGYGPIETEVCDRFIVTDKSHIVKEIIKIDDLADVKTHTFKNDGYVYMCTNCPASSGVEMFHLTHSTKFITSPESAEVGQMLIVEAVSENGFPVSWKTVNPSSGGGATVSFPIYNATEHGISTDAENNTPALQTLVDLIHTKGGGTIFFPIGTYNFKKSEIVGVQYENSFIEFAAIWAKSNVSIVGENEKLTVFKQTEATPYAMFGYQGNPDNPIVGCAYRNFTVSAYNTAWTSATGNKVYSKTFSYQYVRDCVFDHLILKGTLATGLGIDFLDRVDIGFVNTIDCGRAYDPEKSGRSGIGIGTGGWSTENFIIHDCTCKGSGQYGIFIENQYNLGWGGTTDYSKGCIIRDCIVHSGMNKGIGILSGKHVSVINCHVYENEADGIYIEGKCRNIKVVSCNFANNSGNGVVVANKVEKHGCVSTVENLVLSDNLIDSNAGDGIKVNPSAPVTNLVIKANELLDNNGNGINVLGNVDSLVIHGNYGKGNANPLVLGKHIFKDFVYKNNMFFGEIINDGTFTGDTTFNELAEKTEAITIPLSEFTAGIKIMPTGLESSDTKAHSSDYIDISSISSDPLLLKMNTVPFSDKFRVAQYDENKAPLSDSFPMISTMPDQVTWTEEHSIDRLDGVKYIRIFVQNIKDENFYVTIT